jgi:hypothetical protein
MFARQPRRAALPFRIRSMNATSMSLAEIQSLVFQKSLKPHRCGGKRLLGLAVVDQGGQQPHHLAARHRHGHAELGHLRLKPVQPGGSARPSDNSRLRLRMARS